MGNNESLKVLSRAYESYGHVNVNESHTDSTKESRLKRITPEEEERTGKKKNYCISSRYWFQFFWIYT